MTEARKWIAAACAGKSVNGLSQTFPNAAVEDAYALQFETLREEKKQGEEPAGKKIAFTADAMREAFGLREPAFGYMLRKDVHPSGFVLPARNLANVRLEPEIAFLLKKDLCGDELSEEDVRQAVSGVCPAFEIVHGRVQSREFCLVDMIGDNASFGGAVVAGNWVPIESLDLGAISVSVSEDERTAAQGMGSGVMGNPLHAVAWLANKLCSMGDGLYAGDLILSGSLTRQIPMKAGKTYCARFSGLGEVKAGSR